MKKETNIFMYNSPQTYRKDLIELRKILTGDKKIEPWHKETLLPRINEYLKPYEKTLPRITVHVQTEKCKLKINGQVFHCETCGNTIFSRLSDGTCVCKDCKAIYDITEKSE